MAEEKEKKDLYTFEHWAKKEDGTWEELTNSESIFKDFEPYHCGIPAITDGFTDFELDPEKCDATNNFQKFERNGYTNEITTDKIVDNVNYHYSANGQVISGCEKGTVILANHPDHDAIIENATAYGTGSDNVTIQVIKNPDSGSQILNIGKDSFTEDYFTSKGLIFPKRLGILLVGGGGGAGGSSWYDPEKNGKSGDQFMCVGGSGGGGGIVWGVIDLEQLTKVSIAVGAGGIGGSNATTDGLDHNHPQKGNNGGKGGSTTLKVDKKIIASANGGGGGAAGHWTNTAGGGNGGGANYDAEYFICCGAIAGAPGISTKKDMDDVFTQERLNKVQFLQDTSNDGRFTYKTENIPARKSHVSTDSTARVPGGPSFGAGAYDDTTADKGGGGCSNGWSGSKNGAKGHWIIFYA